jgi:hypothetical protein
MHGERTTIESCRICSNPATKSHPIIEAKRAGGRSKLKPGYYGRVLAQFVPLLLHFDLSLSQADYAMSSTEHFLDSLLHQKSLLDNSPFLDATSQRGLESSYCLFNNLIKPSASRQTQNRRDKARQHLKNIYSIAKPLFVLVAVTISVTDLAALDHKKIFPRLEIWWENNAPSQKFESRAIELINELDHERERGGLVQVQRKLFVPPINELMLILLKDRTKSRTLRKLPVKRKRVGHSVSPPEPAPQSSPVQNILSEFGGVLPLFKLLGVY